MSQIRFLKNTMDATSNVYEKFMDEENAEKTSAYHRSFPQYEKTPLTELKNLSQKLGLKSICVKDESYRFGLNAFKVLGSSFAVGNIYSEKTGIKNPSYSDLMSEEGREYFKSLTLYTATDGNHGRGVAWTANALGASCVVRMPKGTVPERLTNIEKLGAVASIEDKVYDDCVKMAHEECERDRNGIFVQDTCVPGYEKIPLWIMQGYLTMTKEVKEQLKEIPTHIFIQAGVGSLAGAVAGYFKCCYRENPPKVIVMEPLGAPCHYESCERKKIHRTEGELKTIMAGLACGEPNPISWDILVNDAFGFMVCSDDLSPLGMRIASSPLKGDERIISGESAGIGLGSLYALMTDENLRHIRDEIGLNEDSRVLLFSTEGDTNKKGYEDIVWKGL